ncbi:MAG: lipid A export permease/ATP-binding protein MsbA [Legionellales bacterium]|nr:lipid A export permease/ATP-binding protein MsbA [Legionellales bacterium]|tara:strand:+ start:2118 stop:3869 length:1752 start_codon:yes stop_codon:yes gene_type:complete
MNTDIILYRRLLSHVVPYWRVFLLSIISMVLLAATDPAIPALMQPLLNGAFIEKDPQTIAFMPFLFVGLFIIRSLSAYISGLSLNWVANKVIMDLRQTMFERFIDYPTSFFDTNRSGSLMSRFTYDVTQIKDASTNAISTIVRDSLSVMGLLGWMFYIDWTLALICLLGAPIIAIIVTIIKRRLRKMSRKVQETMADIHHVLAECFDAQKVIKLYGGQKLEKQRFFKTVNAHRRFAMKFLSASVATGPAIQICTAILLAIIIYVATQQASSDNLLVGDFVSFFAAIAMILGPLKRLAGVNEHIQKGLAASESVFNILDTDIEPQSGYKNLTDVRGALEFKNASYSYPEAKTETLDSISLVIKPGETVALVGESGSGKTTLANLIPRFYELHAGTILYDDIDITKLSLLSLRKNIAYVSQDVVLFNDSVRNNIAYGDKNNSSDEAIWAAAEAACAIEFIKDLPEKMDTIVGEDGTRLSGGQRQRLAIARALLKDARLLILDEATSSLDTRSERHIQSALDNVKRGRTSLIIAHRLSTIENADHIIVLDKGHIVEEGKHDELLKLQNHYARLHQIQFREYEAISS